MGYAKTLSLQKDLVRRRVAGEVSDTLLFVEHPHVITLGKMARRENLLAMRPDVEVFETDRGGDVTYHGPGQLVGYPILDLAPDRQDVHRYVRDLEEVMIRASADYGVVADRLAGLTGVWVGEHKIGAIGVRIARWVTSHGFAFNVTTDLAPFSLIVPCGLRERGVTSLARELGREPEMTEVEERLAEHLAAVFGRELAQATVVADPGGP
jgi:lipoyl(octanoyl) transferase